MSYDSTQDFINDLAKLPDLPAEQRGEWVHAVWSQWIDGVFYNDREDPNCVVLLQRVANNEEGFDDTVLEHEVGIQYGADQRHLQMLTMSPRSAIDLGYHLIAAGTTAMRDLGRHAWFLAGQPAAGGDSHGQGVRDSAETSGGEK